MKKSLVHILYVKQQLYSFRMVENKSIRDKLKKIHKIIDDLENIEAEIDDEGEYLLLLNSLAISFDYFNYFFLYGKEVTITLDEFQRIVRSNKFLKIKDLKFDDNDEGSRLPKGRSESI